MVSCKHVDFEEIAALENQPGLEAKVATHHMKLYHLVCAMNHPVVVEFGVDKGFSTCLFLNACEQTGGHLYSVDITDCSDVAKSDAWTFVQQDDLKLDAILGQAPAIANGIDHLHIDSYHSGRHVRDLLMLWFPYVKAGGHITFHDVDPTPYVPGQRKNNPSLEYGVTKIAEAVRQFFYANQDQLFLEFHFGSTGMGIMKKLSPLRTQPIPPSPRQQRKLFYLQILLQRVRNRLR